MTNYLIVVPRGNTELFDLLSVAFRGHTGFNVVIDRRGAEANDTPLAAASDADVERRGGRVRLGPDEIVVAERAERADRPVAGGEPRSYQHIPVRRRRAGRSPARTAGATRAKRHDTPGTGRATAC
jgi:hypothetical protein